jgi:hypothetical protein
MVRNTFSLERDMMCDDDADDVSGINGAVGRVWREHAGGPRLCFLNAVFALKL